MKNNALDVLENHKHNFSDGEMRIYNVVTKNIKSIDEMTIGELSEKSNSSWGSISKFFNKCGFTGFKGFKQDAYHSKNSDISHVSTVAMTIQSELSTPSIDRSIKRLGDLVKANRVIIIGSRHSKYIANDFIKKCRLINYEVRFDEYDSFKERIGNKDFLIFTSMSGTREIRIKRYLRYVKEATGRDVQYAYFSSSPMKLNINPNINIQPEKTNYAWKYEKEIPRASFFGYAFLFDRLFEYIFDSDKDRHLRLLEIIHERNTEK